MERKRRVRAIWGLAGAVLAVAAIVVPLLVLAGSGQATLTAETYADVIRFGVQGAGTLQIQIYDLSEKELWDSGAISSDFIDWDRTDTWGERLANGYYLYLAQAWDASGRLVLSKTGKVALLPGDQVQLQSAPEHVSSSNPGDAGSDSASTTPLLSAKAVNVDHSTESWAFGQVGIGTTSPHAALELMSSTDFQMLQQRPAASSGAVWGGNGGNARFMLGVDSQNNAALELDRGKLGFNQGSALYIDFAFSDDADYDARFIMTDAGLLQLTGDASFAYTGSGNVGIGTASATDKLTIEGATGNLIACYPGAARTPGSAVFRVESDGDTYADGSVYASKFITVSGAADVAERINASEWVEAGNVVEIDPEHPGFFRKSAGAYSTRVAGIISTSPGVVLGRKSDPESDPWDDKRPVLAIAGRVPVKVTTENGPIAIGDLLVASSLPGVAMKGSPALSIGCVVGKAMEPFAEGEGVVIAQVMLR